MLRPVVLTGLDLLDSLAERQDRAGGGELIRRAAEYAFDGVQIDGQVLRPVARPHVAEQGTRQTMNAPAATHFVALKDKQAIVRHHQAGEIAVGNAENEDRS